MNNIDLKKLNCNNYHVTDSDGDFWYAQNGMRSLYLYSKISDISLRELCEKLTLLGEITINDIRNNDNDTLTITLI